MPAPAVIDSLEFARTGQHLSGDLPIRRLSRLEDVVADPGGDIAYEVDGARDQRNRPLLRLHIHGTLKLRCQRCLEAFEHDLDVASDILVVQPGAVPDDVDDPDAPDYIEAERELDLAALVEDEVLLALPFAPRHETECVERRPGGGDAAQEPNPFARLAALKNIRKA